MHFLSTTGLAGALLAAGLSVIAIGATRLARGAAGARPLDLLPGAALIGGACAVALSRTSSPEWIVFGVGLAAVNAVGYLLQTRAAGAEHGFGPSAASRARSLPETPGTLGRWLSARSTRRLDEDEPT